MGPSCKARNVAPEEFFRGPDLQLPEREPGDWFVQEIHGQPGYYEMWFCLPNRSAGCIPLRPTHPTEGRPSWNITDHNLETISLTPSILHGGRTTPRPGWYWHGWLTKGRFEACE